MPEIKPRNIARLLFCEHARIIPMILPTHIPEPGFYYHYKHDDAKGITDFAYEVLGTGVHTEEDCRPEDMHMVMYRPLYDCDVYRAGKLAYLRPLSMWGDVTKDGKTFPRFQKITDANLLQELEAIRARMYL